MAWTGDMNKYGLKYEILYPNEGLERRVLLGVFSQNDRYGKPVQFLL